MGKQQANSDGTSRALIFGLSALTFIPIVVVLLCSAWTLIEDRIGGDAHEDAAASQAILIALHLGSVIATAGLSAVVICLALRLRDGSRDLVAPPALTGPIVVVAIGAAVVLGTVLSTR